LRFWRKDNESKKKLIFLIILLALPLVSAVTISNTTIGSRGLGSEINISNFNITLDKLMIQNNAVIFYNLSYTNPNAEFNFSFDNTFNWTATSLNVSDDELPYVSGYNLYYGMETTIRNQDVRFNVVSCRIQEVVYVSGGYTKIWRPAAFPFDNDCTGDILTMEDVELQRDGGISVTYLPGGGVGGGGGFFVNITNITEPLVVVLEVPEVPKGLTFEGIVLIVLVSTGIWVLLILGGFIVVKRRKKKKKEKSWFEKNLSWGF